MENKEIQDKKTKDKEIYEYLENFSETIYRNEERRENNIIEQTGRMQAAFSFVIIALFTLLPAIVSIKTLPIWFKVVSFSTTALMLFLSLVFATIAQSRKKRHDFPSVTAIKKEILENRDYYGKYEKRQRYLIDTYETMHTSYEKNNNFRSTCVKTSMIMFYISIGLFVEWFIVGLFMII